jgi:uncharacterized repeat protein (TIGR02543 family)
MMAAGTNALVFQAGSVVSLAAGFAGNVFGTGVSPGALNSVVFQSGSLYAQASGANPFGATAPSTVVTFQPGSRFRLDATLTPSMSGRNFGDFQLNTGGAVSPNGANAFTMDSLIITQGTLNLGSLTGGGTIRGDITVKPGATLTSSPASAGPIVTLGGSSTQTIGVLGTFGTNGFSAFVLNNPAGVALSTALTLNGSLSITSGKIMTGSNVLAISSTGSLNGASQAAGYVAGNLRRTIAAGSSSMKFDVGDAAVYAPVTVATTGAAGAFDLTGASRTPDHPNLGTSDLDPGKSVNRYWTLTPTGSPSFTSYDATFAFAAGDVDAGASPANFLVRRYSGSWNAATAGTRTATSTQATGLTAFGDFAIAELLTYALTVNIVGSGTVARSPDQASYTPGAVATLTATPADGWTFSGWSGSASGSTNPLDVTMDGNKTITATFTSTVGVGTGGVATLALARPSPNPSRGSALINFSLPHEGHAKLDILDLGGRRIWHTESMLPAGAHTRVWDGRGADGSAAGAGLYFIRLTTPWGTRTERLVRLR